MSDRPGSGEFTFSPSQLKKKLKLEVPYNSTRVSKDGESRKISSSYLGDTQNTITNLHQHKKRGLQSAYAAHNPSMGEYLKNSHKHSLKNKSLSVSPKKKSSLHPINNSNMYLTQHVNARS